jgi:hypothetical protein
MVHGVEIFLEGSLAGRGENHKIDELMIVPLEEFIPLALGDVPINRRGNGGGEVGMQIRQM